MAESRCHRRTAAVRGLTDCRAPGLEQEHAFRAPGWPGVSCHHGLRWTLGHPHARGALGFNKNSSRPQAARFVMPFPGSCPSQKVRPCFRSQPNFVPVMVSVIKTLAKLKAIFSDGTSCEMSPPNS